MGPPRDPASQKAFLIGASLAAVSAVLSALTSTFVGDTFVADGEAIATRGCLLSAAMAALFLIFASCPHAIGRRASVCLVSGALLVGGFEALAGPFIQRDATTTLFQRDPHLGWRLRPGADDRWLGARVKINPYGMRGNEPREGVSQRILLLGDSVTFGAFLKSDSDTISAQMTTRFRGDALDAQCLNGGVGGWAPWQERRWYEDEGADLGAGVVLINLVLNDVTEPLSLKAFGGSEDGYQLDRTRDPGFFAETTWATAIRRLRKAIQREGSRERAASAEALGVYELLRSPALPASRTAWEQHLQEVSALVVSIRAHGATPVVVSHPYTVQFEVDGLWWPQDSLARWCSAADVPFFDVGRHLSQSDSDPLGAYSDGVHPNAAGAGLIAAGLAEFLHSRGLVH